MANCCDQFGTCARVTVIMMTISGVVLQILAALECEFLKFEGSSFASGTLGLWEFSIRSNGNQCISFPDNDVVGGFIQSARITILISLSAAAVAFALVLVEFFLCRIPCAGICTGIIYMIAWMCGVATFSMYGSDFCALNPASSCTLGSGAIYNIAATCLYFVSSFMVCCLPKSPGLMCSRGDDSDDNGNDDDEAIPAPAAASHDHEYEGPPMDSAPDV